MSFDVIKTVEIDVDCPVGGGMRRPENANDRPRILRVLFWLSADGCTPCAAMNVWPVCKPVSLATVAPITASNGRTGGVFPAWVPI